MRLTNLRVKDFGCVREANVRFGPGLNVLFGPNDLGKSSLAEAIRTALLLPHGSQYGTGFAPWRSDATPIVELVFETEPQRFWRIRKSFGSGSRGSSVFEFSKDGSSFSEEARARAVDAEIRKHLRWGIPEPGGKGGPKGLPDSFLTTVLLARQDGVTALFDRSLGGDADESGRKRIAEALQAAAQDPLFAKVVERTQGRVDEAFTPTGRLRTHRSSPFRQVKEQLDAAERDFKALDDRERESQATREEVQTLAEQAVFEEAERDSAKVALQQIDAVLAKQEEISRVRAEVKRIDALRRAAEAAAESTETAKRDLERYGEGLRQAVQAAQAIEDAFAKSKAEVERLESGAAAQARIAERTALEKALVEGQASLADVVRVAERARLVSELDERATLLHAEAAAADEIAASLQAQRNTAKTTLERFGPLLLTRRHFQQAVAEVARIDGLRRAAADARAKHEAATSEAVGFDRRIEQTRRVFQKAEEAVGAAKAEVERIQRAESAQARLTRHATLERDITEKESALEHAQRLVDRASHVRELDLRAATVRAQADETRGRAESLEQDATAHADSVADSERQLHAMRGIGLWLQRDEFASRAARAAATTKSKETLENDLVAAEENARTLQEAVDSSRLPSPEQMVELDAVERELQVALASVDTPLAIELEALEALDVDVDGSVRSIPRGGSSSFGAAGELAFELVGLARVRVRGGDAILRGRLDRARLQFETLVAPTLAESGSRDLDELRQAVEKVRSMRSQVRDAWTRVDNLRERLQALDGSSDSLEALTARIEAVDEKLTDYPVQLLAERAGGLGPGARTEVEASIAALERSVAVAQKARQDAESLATAAHSKLEVLLDTAEQAETVRDNAATDLGDPWSDVLEASRRQVVDLGEDIRHRRFELEKLAEGEEATLKESRARLEFLLSERESAKLALDASEQEHRAHTKKLDELAGVASVRRETAEAEDYQAAVAVRDALELELEALPQPTPNTDVNVEIDELEKMAARAREDFETIEARASSSRSQSLVARSSAQQARAAFDKAAAELGEPWSDILAPAERQIEELRALVESQRDELATFASVEQDRLQEARRLLESQTKALAVAREDLRGLEEAQRARTTTLDVLVGEARVRREAAEAEDLDEATSVVETLVRERAALPLPENVAEANEEIRQAAAHRLDEAERRLGGVRAELHTAEGALAHVGGEVVRERREGALAALNRFRDAERNLELEYKAWQLLLETLKDAERSQATHLGQSMVEPIAKRFAELTASRYGELALGPELDVGGITASGGTRDIQQLSVGTREQLSTVFRLSLAEQLESVVLLDDQLTQTDPCRMNWFKQRLREFAGKIQIIVITCRPQDYLQADEIPVAGKTYDGENVRAVNLEFVIERTS